jgi:hypothetical protein
MSWMPANSAAASSACAGAVDQVVVVDLGRLVLSAPATPMVCGRQRAKPIWDWSPQTPRISPDDLASELNPHETRVEPHKPTPCSQPRQNRPPRFPRSRKPARHGNWHGRNRHAPWVHTRCPLRSATVTGRACAQVTADLAHIPPPGIDGPRRADKGDLFAGLLRPAGRLNARSCR